MKEKIRASFSVRDVFSCFSLFTAVVAGSFSPNISAASDLVPPADEGVYLIEYPVVLSVTRLPQTADQAPMAVSVIDRRMIEASGVRELYELFRLVPGMIVGVKDGSTQAVSYRSLSTEYARRMEVLIDGRSIYTPAWSGVYWSDIPIILDDIERIEVIRGPDSVQYGANAFFGVVNIVTREAVLDQGSSVRVNYGTDGVRDAYLRHGGRQGALDYHVTLGHSQDEGLDNRFDSKETRILNLRGDYQRGLQDEFNIHLGFAQGDREIEPLPASATNAQRVKERLSHYEQLTWQRSFNSDDVLSLRYTHSVHDNDEAFWSEPLPIDEQPLYALIANGHRVPIDYSLHTQRHDLELEHRFSLSDTYRVVWGVGSRIDKAEAAGLFDGNSVENKMKFGFANLEWQLKSGLLFNAGLFTESHSITGTERSTRLGLNYRATGDHFFRITAARASRVPTLIETSADGWIHAEAMVPGGMIHKYLFEGNPDLSSESIFSREIGYHGYFFHRQVELDAKLFYEKAEDLIVNVTVDSTENNNLDGKVDRFFNFDDATMKGFEAELDMHASRKTWIQLAYAYTVIDSTDRGTKIRYEGSAPKHNISLLAATKLGNEIQASAAFSYLDNKMKGWDVDAYRDPVRRLDLRFARQFQSDSGPLELAVQLRNVLGKYEAIQLLRPKENFDYVNEIGPSAYISAKLNIQ